MELLQCCSAGTPRYDSFKQLIIAADQLCWLPAILFYRCSIDLFSRRLISEVACPIVTKLCHMFDDDPDL